MEPDAPTSVYLAFPGVAQLVEVYAPDADEARTLALSGSHPPGSPALLTAVRIPLIPAKGHRPFG